MVNIKIINETNFNFKYKRKYKKIVKETLKILKIKGDSELSVIITDNKGIKKISKKYRNKNQATDILSFPAGFNDMIDLIGYNMFGDIYLSYEKVEAQANEFNHSSKREWCYLFVHGLLHLIGCDHKIEKQEKEMNSIAYKVMDKIKVGRNE